MYARRDLATLQDITRFIITSIELTIGHLKEGTEDWEELTISRKLS